MNDFAFESKALASKIAHLVKTNQLDLECLAVLEKQDGEFVEVCNVATSYEMYVNNPPVETKGFSEVYWNKSFSDTHYFSMIEWEEKRAFAPDVFDALNLEDAPEFSAIDWLEDYEGCVKKLAIIERVKESDINCSTSDAEVKRIIEGAK